MDNLENYLYLAFAVIYIISRVLKGRGKQNIPQKRSQNPSNDPSQQPRRKKGFSFEDIIKEFEKSLGEQQEEEVFPAEEIRHQKPAPVPVVETTKKSNKYEQFEGTSFKQRRSETTSKQGLKLVPDDKYAIKDKVAVDYVNELQTPEDFKRAFVLSEIINRKYF